MPSDKHQAVIRRIVLHGVAGDDGHKQECLEFAWNNITQDWSNVYSNTSFLYLIDLANSIHIKDVSFTLNCQALDLIYLLIADNKLDRYNPHSSFSLKLKTVFMDIYGWKMPEDTANIIRIVRNNVMHTGVVGGVESSIKSHEDIKSVQEYMKKYQLNAMDDICGSFRQLVNDMTLRILGLRQEPHLARNGTPVWAYVYFGYTPEITSVDKL